MLALRRQWFQSNAQRLMKVLRKIFWQLFKKQGLSVKDLKLPKKKKSRAEKCYIKIIIHYTGLRLDLRWQKKESLNLKIDK